ncbi:MAG: hypothetical protein QXU11_01295 [Thermoproteota archaeon]
MKCKYGDDLELVLRNIAELKHLRHTLRQAFRRVLADADIDEVIKELVI